MKLEQLQAQLDALGDVADVVQTDRELQKFYNAQQGLLQRIGTIRNTVPDLAKLDAKIAAIARWTTNLTSWRQEFIDRTTALPQQRRTREQDDEMLSLTQSIKNIDHGAEQWNGVAAIGAALADNIKATYPPTWDGSRDPWQMGFGSLPAAEARLEEARQRRAELQRRLDLALQDEPVTV